MGFTEQEIATAKAYKYNGRDDSIFIKLFYRKFWDYMVTFIPMWVAPNLVTLFGFFFEIFSFVLSFYYSNGLTQPIPAWVKFVNGACLAFYQLLDNLDGRQARRTGNSSPLGQFFDHGCDAITGVSELFKVAASFNMGLSDETFFFIFIMGFGFCFTSWEEYVTHAFYLGPINGPDEGLTLLWLAHFAVCFFPELSVLPSYPIVQIIFLISGAVTIGGIIFNVIKKSIGNPQMVKTGVLSVLPCFISSAIFLALKFTNKAASENVYFIMSAGYILQYGAQVIIISFLVGRPPSALFNLQTVALWGVALAALFMPNLNSIEGFWKYYYFGIVTIMVTFDLDVVYGLCKGLGIHALKIKVKAQ